MSKFKRVLEIEKKYDHIVKTAKRKSGDELESFVDELKLKEDVIKQDFKRELERDFKRELDSIKNQGEDELKRAKEQADFIYKNANREEVVDFLMKEVEKIV